MRAKFTKTTFFFFITFMAWSAFAGKIPILKKAKASIIFLDYKISSKLSVFIGKQVTDLNSVKATIAAKNEESPQPSTTNFEMKIIEKVRNGDYNVEANFNCNKTSSCLFAKDAKPLGETYTLTLLLLDKNGKQIGQKASIDVKVELEKKINNRDTTNACSGSYNFKNGIYSIVTDNSGIKIWTVSSVSIVNIGKQDKETSKEAIYIEAIGKFTDCNGKTVYIGLPLKYNAKTKEYSATQTLPKCNTSQYKLESIDHKVKDGCGNTNNYKSGKPIRGRWRIKHYRVWEQ